MLRGWFVGDFKPTAFRTKKFEVGYLKHKKNENWPTHFHKKSVEINLLIEGAMKIKGKILKKGDIFILDKKEVADPIFLKDCSIVCIKIPSLPNDKYIIRK